MKKELTNMNLLLEQNKDLKEELARLQTLTYDERTHEIATENHELRKLNGEMRVRLTEATMDLTKLKKELSFVPKNAGLIGPSEIRARP